MKITLVGHSTLLIEMGQTRVLTDPYFGAGNTAYERLTPPAQPASSLPKVDMVLVSHLHWDHIDLDYLRSLGEDVPITTSIPNRGFLRLTGIKNVQSLPLWQPRPLNDIRLIAVPALHPVPAIGFILQSDTEQVYFAGDTYYGPFMSELGRKFQIDVALLPVTTYRIPMTMGEKSAVLAVQSICPGVVIPIHLGIQPRIPLMRTNDTPEGFKSRVKASGLKSEVVILQPGQCWEG